MADSVHEMQHDIETFVYDGIKDLITQAHKMDNLRECDVSLAIHTAIAKSMSDVITDIKINPNVSTLPKSFVEQWALTQYQMKDKQDYFMRFWLNQNKMVGSVLHLTELLPYQPADISTSLETCTALEANTMLQKHNDACSKLKVTLSRLAYKLRSEIPAIEANKQDVKTVMEDIEKSVPETYRASVLEIENKKLTDIENQLKMTEQSCFYFLKKEEEALKHIVVEYAGTNGYDKIPVIEELIPVDESKRAAPLNDTQKSYDYIKHLDELRKIYSMNSKDKHLDEIQKHVIFERETPTSDCKKKRGGRKNKFPIGSNVIVRYEQNDYPAKITNYFGSSNYQVKYDGDGEIVENFVKPLRIKFPDDVNSFSPPVSSKRCKRNSTGN